MYAVGQEVILRKTLLDKYEADVFFFFFFIHCHGFFEFIIFYCWEGSKTEISCIIDIIKQFLFLLFLLLL